MPTPRSLVSPKGDEVILWERGRPINLLGDPTDSRRGTSWNGTTLGQLGATAKESVAMTRGQDGCPLLARESELLDSNATAWC